MTARSLLDLYAAATQLDPPVTDAPRSDGYRSIPSCLCNPFEIILATRLVFYRSTISESGAL